MPRRRGIRCQGVPSAQSGDPGSRDDRTIQDREHGPIVLEPMALTGFPDRNEILGARKAGITRNRQALELHGTRTTGGRVLAEDEERWCRGSIRYRRVQSFEKTTQDLIATPLRIVQLVAWGLVVAEVGESTSAQIDSIRPILLLATGVEDDAVISFTAAGWAKAPLVSGSWKHARDRIITTMPSRPAHVDGIDDEIGATQCVELVLLSENRNHGPHPKRSTECVLLRVRSSPETFRLGEISDIASYAYRLFDAREKFRELKRPCLVDVLDVCNQSTQVVVESIC